jgi:ABC-type arginine/histidine transport system permease subunit
MDLIDEIENAWRHCVETFTLCRAQRYWGDCLRGHCVRCVLGALVEAAITVDYDALGLRQRILWPLASKVVLPQF